jgi:hypothetical protein
MKKPAALLALILTLAIFPALGEAVEETINPAEAVQADAVPADAGQNEAAEASPPATQGEAEVAATVPDEITQGPPPFSLDPQEGDGPRRLRLKAALRLWKHAQITTKALQTCPPAETPGAGKALNGFQARNGNTLRLLMSNIQKSGGLTPEIKALLDKEVTAGTAELLKETDCATLTDLVSQNARDIYKAPELAEDYALARSQP